MTPEALARIQADIDHAFAYDRAREAVDRIAVDAVMTRHWDG